MTNALLLAKKGTAGYMKVTTALLEGWVKLPGHAGTICRGQLRLDMLSPVIVCNK